MKLFVSIVSLSLLLLKVSAQDLKGYYRNVHKAELCIVDLNYAKAKLYYDSAFACKSEPFAQDLFNAALTCIYTKHYPESLRHIGTLVKLGGKPYITLSKVKNCKDFINSEYGDSAKQIEKKRRFIYDTFYRAAIENLYAYDQEFRIKKGGSTKYYDTIKQIDKIIVDSLLRLIKKNGFPSEYKVGIYPTNFSSPIYTILLMHQQTGATFRSFDYSPLLKEAILKGEIRNVIGAHFVDAAMGVQKYETFGLVMVQFDTTTLQYNKKNQPSQKDTTYSTNWGYFKLGDSDIAKYNEARSELLLAPMEDELKKLKFVLNNSEFLLGNGAKKTIFKVISFNQFLQIKQNLIDK